MDIYDNHTAVEYGRVDFSPDATPDSKERTIKLPTNTPIDNVIRGNFTKRSSVHAHPPKENRPKQKSIAEIQNEGALNMLKGMCETKGIVVEDDWDAERMQTEIENYVAPPVALAEPKVLPENIESLNKEQLQASCTARNIPFVDSPEETKAVLRDKLVAWAAE